MKKLMILCLAMGMCLASFSVKAEEQIAAQAPAAVEVGNNICPVSGDKIGAMGEVVKQEYKGKIYNFCCGMCLKDFNKDPEKYSKIADDEVKVNQEAETKN